MEKPQKENYTWKQIWLPPILGAIAMVLLAYMVYWHLNEKRNRKMNKDQKIQFNQKHK